MTEGTAEDWGRLAVSLPGWRWTSGMHDTEGRTYVGCGEWVEVEGCAGLSITAGRDDPLPDPDDPATAGCLLALLGDRLLGVFRRGDEWIVRINGYAADHAGSTLGRACIAAAVLLGRWPGGEG